MRIPAALFLTLPLFACSGSDSNSAGKELRCTSPTESSPMLGEDFTVHIHESAVVQGEGLNLVFSAVEGDSRCPVDVQCVWEGNGQVDVIAQKSPNSAQTLVLNTNPSFATRADYLVYHVDLLSLVPYPHADSQIGPDDYCVTLRVTRD
jgi:hypothetical protein